MLNADEMIGTALGHYTILSILGRGGMGEVWKARDAKLGRDVAIKTLPLEFANDAERLARFEREARLLASLSHPNIAAIHGLEQSGNTRFLVLELIEGDTLAEMVARGPIPVEESLRLAQQIAQALEAAHDKGIVHRDLKPANIKVTTEGVVKVLDFGLAKFSAAEESRVSISNSPTISAAATRQGVILGTAAYMAPEQARGRAVDKRGDIWAFGCVLFECLTGRTVFPGEDVSDVLASVLKSEPHWDSLPPNVNPRLRDLLQRCLRKDPQKRYRDIADVRLEIEDLLANPAGLIVSSDKSTGKPSRATWAAGFLLAALTGAAVWYLKPAPAPAPPPVFRFVHEVPATVSMNLAQPVLAISPTADQFVYATEDGLYVRRMDELEARRISGTEGEATADPFFSPNGKWVGYLNSASGEIKKVPTTGGKPEFLVKVDGSTFGASWAVNGWILYIQQPRIMRVSENGGEPSVLFDAGERVVTPVLLPDGDSLLFRVARGAGAGVIVRSLTSKKQTVLFTDADSSVKYLASGHLIYGAGNDVYVRAFNLKTLAVGERVPLVQNFFRAFPLSAPQFQVSGSGTLIYIPATSGGTSPSRTIRMNLTRLNRSGKPETLPATLADYRNPRFSPDDKRIAVEVRGEDGTSNIWIYELARNVLTQLTFDGGADPLWSPKGEKVVYLKNNGVWSVSSNFTDSPTLLAGTETPGNRGPGSWSSDGEVLLFTSDAGIHAWQGKNTSAPAAVIVPARDGVMPSLPEFSSDGHWFVYMVSASRAESPPELYVSSYPVGGSSPRKITTGGGLLPVWIRSPQEILFLAPGDGETSRGAATRAGRGSRGPTFWGQFSLLSLPITTEPNFTRLNPVTLFDFPGATGAQQRFFDVSHDGQRFIVPLTNEVAASAADGPAVATSNAERRRIHVIFNWFEEIKDRVPPPSAGTQR